MRQQTDNSPWQPCRNPVNASDEIFRGKIREGPKTSIARTSSDRKIPNQIFRTLKGLRDSLEQDEVMRESQDWVGVVGTIVGYGVGFATVYFITKTLLDRYFKGKTQPQPTAPPSFGSP